MELEIETVSQQKTFYNYIEYIIYQCLGGRGEGGIFVVDYHVKYKCFRHLEWVNYKI